MPATPGHYSPAPRYGRRPRCNPPGRHRGNQFRTNRKNTPCACGTAAEKRNTGRKIQTGRGDGSRRCLSWGGIRLEASVIAITLFVKNNRIKLSLSQCGFRGCCSCHVPLPWAKSGVSLKVKADRRRVRLLPCWHHNAGKKGCQGRQIPNAGNLDRKSDATAPSAPYAEAGKRSTRPENTLKIAMIPTTRTDCLRTRNLIHKGLLLYMPQKQAE